jgi:hypothetical protein
MLDFSRDVSLFNTAFAEPQTRWNFVEASTAIMENGVAGEVHPIAEDEVLVLARFLTLLAKFDHQIW